jgi:site-specific DNA recombinase
MPKRKAVEAAAIYCRISLDSQGEGLGVMRQQELCEKLAAERGWLVSEIYVDNDKSAYSGKPRPAYERMLVDLEARRRDAVICVDLDRLTRRPVELERFMDLADQRGVALANVSGDTDLSSSDGRFRARIMGAVARQESEKKAERVAREAEQAARRGIPRGSRRPYGWEDDKTTLRPDEAELVREAVRRVLGGETVPALCRDWNERGIPSPQEAPHGWSASSLVNILRNPRIAGLRTYKREIVADGLWEPIVDRATWEGLQGRIRRTARIGRPSTHLLSGIARCGYCKRPLWTSWRSGTRRRDGKPYPRVERYACIKRPGSDGCGRCTVTAAPLDAMVRDGVIYRLTSREFETALERGSKRDDEQAVASRELAAAEERIEELAADFAAGTISRREWLAAREKLTERIAKASRVLDRHRGILADLPRGEKALREAWDVASIEWKRELIRSVVDYVLIKPGKPTPRFDSSRVDIVPR